MMRRSLLVLCALAACTTSTDSTRDVCGNGADRARRGLRLERRRAACAAPSRAPPRSGLPDRRLRVRRRRRSATRPGGALAPADRRRGRSRSTSSGSPTSITTAPATCSASSKTSIVVRHGDAAGALAGGRLVGHAVADRGPRRSAISTAMARIDVTLATPDGLVSYTVAVPARCTPLAVAEPIIGANSRARSSACCSGSRRSRSAASSSMPTTRVCLLVVDLLDSGERRDRGAVLARNGPLTTPRVLDRRTSTSIRCATRHCCRPTSWSR